MASSTAALKKAVQSVTKGDQPGVTDQELVRRFVTDGDQPAFAALVGRHTAMVLGVCRRALPTVQDAEDAVQATFLILAQKAGRIRWQSSVAGWLYVTARQVTHNARVAARRRARREARAAVPEVVQPLDRVSGRELLATLDDELERLPPCYRDPLVLCYLEGLTRDEAAARLGVPVKTLHSRVDRGRKKLHDALTASGCAMGAGLLALAATSPAGASPPRLVKAVLAAVSGSVPDAVAELAKGVVVNGVINKTLPALAALLACVALGIGLGSVAPQAAGPVPDRAARQARADDKGPKPAPETPKPVTVSGRVLDPDSKPLAGAKLVLLGHKDKPGDLGTTGADGRFKVEVPVDRKNLDVVVLAEGVGLDFVGLAKINPDTEVELRVVKDHPIHGRLVDTQGKAVAGAKVSVKSVHVYAGNSLDSFLIEWKKRRPNKGLPEGVKHLWREGGAFPETTTDTAGRFTVAGTGEERLVQLHVRADGLAEAELWVVNRNGFDPNPYNQADTVTTWLLHGPNPNLVGEAEKPIRGVVKDADTGKPRPGVKVWLTRSGEELLPISLSATTDAEGRYEIRGARKTSAYMVEVASDSATGHMACQARAVDTAGYEPIIADVRMKKGVIVTGKVIDAATKQAVPGFVMVGVLADNPFVKDFPEFDSYALFPRKETNPDGTFRVVTLPGPVLLMGGPRLADGLLGRAKYKPAVPDPMFPQYFETREGFTEYFGPGNHVDVLQGNFCKVLDIKPNAELVTHDIVLEPATALNVRVQDGDGRPVAGTWVTGISSEEWHEPVWIEKDTCPAFLLEPGKPRLMVIYEPTRKRFATLALKGDEKEPAVATLAEAGTVKGRLLDEGGKPLAGTVVTLDYRDRTAKEIHEYVYRAKRVETEPNGEFRIDEVIPGVKFSLTFTRGKHALEPVDKLDDQLAKPGAATEVGPLKLRPKTGNNGL